MGEFAGLAVKIGKVNDIVSGPGLRRGLTAVGMGAKDDLTKAGSDAVGSDLVFSGWKKAKLSSGFDIEGTTVIVKPRPGGPWIVAERGRKGGAMIPKRKSRVILRTPWGPRTFTKAHPMRVGATRGKNALTNATHVIQRKSPERLDDSIQQQLRAVF